MGTKGKKKAEKKTKPWSPTVKQQKFIDAYEGNATKAAKDAGYSEKTAYSQGQRLLKNVEILQAILNRQQEERKSTIADRQERGEVLSGILRNNRAIQLEKPVQGCDSANNEENGDHLFVVLDSVNKDVIKSIDTLNKMDGLYVQRHQVTGKDGEPLVTNVIVYLPDNKRAKDGNH